MAESEDANKIKFGGLKWLTVRSLDVYAGASLDVAHAVVHGHLINCQAFHTDTINFNNGINVVQGWWICNTVVTAMAECWARRLGCTTNWQLRMPSFIQKTVFARQGRPPHQSPRDSRELGFDRTNVNFKNFRLQRWLISLIFCFVFLLGPTRTSQFYCINAGRLGGGICAWGAGFCIWAGPSTSSRYWQWLRLRAPTRNFLDYSGAPSCWI